MPLNIPSTQQSADQNLARLESALSQTSPLADKAFLRVLAVLEAMSVTGLYKMAAERIKQVLALTATGFDLDILGAEYNTYRKAAETARLTVVLPALTDTVIPVTSEFIGTANGMLYYLDAAATAIGGVATLSLTASFPGTVGNLVDDDVLTIVSPIAGAESIATVIATTNTGAEEETDTGYRPRVQFAMRATTGGSNATDHKIWAEEVAGVFRAFPYAGKPVGGGTSYPGDRTVYIEADTSIDPDGVPTVGLLAEVTSSLLFDPVTSRSRSTLGLSGDNLYVEAIVRNAVAIIITDLVTPSGQEATVKAAISIALLNYFLAIAPYVEGVDLEQDRNDRITTPSVSEVVQQVIGSMVSSASDVGFSVGGTPYDTYTLAAGELVKIGVITYA